MKRFSFAIAILIMAALICPSIAAAADYSKIIPAAPLVLIKMDLKQFTGSKLFSALNVGAFKKVADQIGPEFEKLTGFSASRDLAEMGFVIEKDIDFSKSEPNKLFLYISGSFDHEKIIGEIEREKEIGIKFEKIGNATVIRLREAGKFMFAFIGKDLFVVGSPDVVTAMIEGKYKAEGVPASIKSDFEKSSIYANFENAGRIKEALAEGPLSNAPKEIAALAEKITSLSVYNGGSAAEMVVRLGLSDKAAAAEISRKYEELKKMAVTMLDAREKDLNEKIKAMSTLELIKSESNNLKLAMAVGREVLDSLKFESSDAAVTLRIIAPEVFKETIGPEVVPVVIGTAAIAAAIAIPNFTKARQKAVGKACTSNMKVIEGACELYMLDNGKLDVTSLEEFKTKGYLKEIPQCREGGRYEFGTDPSASKVNVKCSLHGKLE